MLRNQLNIIPTNNIQNLNRLHIIILVSNMLTKLKFPRSVSQQQK